MLVSLLITLAALGVNLATSGAVAGVAKMVASCGFLALAITAGALQTGYGRVLFIGLLFSWWGDLFLIFSGPPWFLCGLIAFFLGHVAYSGAFLWLGIDWRWSIAALLPLGVFVYFIFNWLNPHLGDMRVPVYAYMVVITLMVLFATGAVGKGATAFVLAGALLFYFSDLFVARGRFVTSSPWNGYIGLPLYYAGQLALAYSARFAGR